MAAPVLIALLATLFGSVAVAQNCTRQGVSVTCDDGRAGIYEGRAILWPDGTRSSLAPHPSVRIGPGVTIGHGVFAGSPGGGGHVPLDPPGAGKSGRCPILDSVSYCH
ncbi:MAG: hypothetical protein ACRCXM_15530 [Beijerinckiaceae bacterium]